VIVGGSGGGFTCRGLRRAVNMSISISIVRGRVDECSRRPLCLMGSCGCVYVVVYIFVMVVVGRSWSWTFTTEDESRRMLKRTL
jgi:hypothetical protein